MNNSIIKVNEIPRVEWRNERVVTTARLAEFYETATDNIKRNFSNNRDRFVEGKHFFKLEGDDLRDLGKIFPQVVAPRTPVLYLWTKRGAARHAKILNTDRAWEVFEALEDNYFNRPAVAFDPLAHAISELVAVEREKLALDRDNFAKAQLLRDIASSSRDYSLRDKLLSEATKLLMGDDFFEDVSDDID